MISDHDDVIKWKHFPRYWPFVRGIHRSPVNSPHKGQRRGALMFSLISSRIIGWVNNREAGDLRRIRPHYDVTVMWIPKHKGIVKLIIPSFMMTSSDGNIFRNTGPLCGEFTGQWGIPSQRSVTLSFDVSLLCALNKRLSTQSWGWWFETPSRSLWRHRNDADHP